MKQRHVIDEIAGFDCNDSDAETGPCSGKDSNRAHIYVTKITGSIAVAELEVWGAGIKKDGTLGDYFLVPNSTISTAAGLDIDLDLCTFEFFKIKVKTVESGTSTVDILINTYWSPFRPS